MSGRAGVVSRLAHVRARPLDREPAFEDAILRFERGGPAAVLDRNAPLAPEPHPTSLARHHETLARLGPASTVFVTDVANVQLARVARALRGRGHNTLIVMVGTVPPPLRDFYAGAAEAVLELASYRELGHLLAGGTSAGVVHVLNHLGRGALGSLVLRRCEDAAVVIEPYDIATVRGTRDNLARQLPPAIVDLDLRCEREVLTAADGVVHRFRPAVAELLAAHHGPLAPTLHLLPYPSRALAVDVAPAPLPHDAPIRLLHASSFPAPSPENEHGMIPWVSLPEVFASLLAQGFAVDALQSPGWPRDFAPDGRYGKLAALTRHPHFSIGNGFAPDELARRYCHHHFGINLAQVSRAPRLAPSQLAHAVGTTVFGFVEAGLPIIASREFRYQAELIEDNQIGIAIAEADIDRLASIVRTLDYPRLQEGVRRFRERAALETRIDTLLDFYRRVA